MPIELFIVLLCLQKYLISGATEFIFTMALCYMHSKLFYNAFPLQTLLEPFPFGLLPLSNLTG